MEQRVELEYVVPQVLGGFCKEVVNDRDVVYKVIGYIVKETDTEIIIAMGESLCYYLHQVRVPKVCITHRTDIVLNNPIP